MKEKHNGWTNYATWRVNLEVFDGISWVEEDVFGDTVGDFADQLQGHVETQLDEEFTSETRDTSLAHSYAHAFIADVNWYEIAEAINGDHNLGLSQ